ncbi:MAG: hypothetical protein PHI48_04200 [Bacteroidales bacterium]|nr:hypothetical protein [Bacteroidales bacterium]
MKKRLLLVCFALFGLSVAQSAETYLLIGGSGTKNVSIFEKSIQKIVWSHDLEAGQECNSVAMNKKGEVLYSYKQGARLISLDHKVIWNYTCSEGSELQSASVLPDGGYLLGICGHPAKIVELDKEGGVRKELSVLINVQNPHQQFRLISKAKNGNYIVPILGTNEILEIDKKGKEINRLNVAVGCFAALELKDDNLLVSGGDSHQFMTINRQTGEISDRVTQNDIEGVSLMYVAQIRVLDNNHRLICNWQGHNQEGDAEEPQLLETDQNNKVVWSLNDKKKFDKISSVFVITPNKTFADYLNKLNR